MIHMNHAQELPMDIAGAVGQFPIGFQDGRPLRRYKRRWKIERLFVQLGCLLILLRRSV
jgi:hypothetical protein